MKLVLSPSVLLLAWSNIPTSNVVAFSNNNALNRSPNFKNSRNAKISFVPETALKSAVAPSLTGKKAGEKTILSLLGGFEEHSFQFQGDLDTSIGSITWDYQKVKPGSIYFCLEDEEFQEGHIQSNGLNHWEDAVRAGAACLVCRKGAISMKSSNIDIVEVDDPNVAMAEMAKVFYDDPLSSMKIIGVTGTNGKTTTTQMINSVLSHVGVRSGTVGTIGNTFPSGMKQEPSHLSNPMATELFKVASEMQEDNTESLTMEVTSHAMAFNRNHAIDFDVAIYTNLSQDHLDFHKTMDAYKQAKMKFFEKIGTGSKTGHGIVNIDDANSSDFINAIDKDLLRSKKANLFTFGIENDQADFVARPLEMTGTNSTFDVYFQGNKLCQVKLPVPGLFNIYNALGTFAAAHAIGISTNDIVDGLASVEKVHGRFQTVKCGADFDVYVDYAHTPDALSKILQEIRSLTDKRIIAVFGCGGDRDASKRGEMGRIACELSDVPVVTSDNPRTESPENIIRDILDGMPAHATKNVRVELDRRTAIYEAMKLARPGDAVLIAGKGHETYQIIGHTTYPFSDPDVVQDFMNMSEDRQNRESHNLNHLSEVAQMGLDYNEAYSEYREWMDAVVSH